MKRTLLAALPCLTLAAVVSPNAWAEDLPGPVRSIVMLETIAGRGESCGLLVPWQAAGLRAQMEVEMRKWDVERRRTAAEAAATRIAETPCEDAFLNQYIETAGPNMESEFLPPYLIAYRVFAAMDDPPTVFTDTALRLDHTDVLTAIETKLSVLEESGRPPEGGKPWPEFVAQTETRVKALLNSLDGDATGERYSADEAAALIAQAVLIMRLWYEGLNEDGAQ